MDLHLLGYTDWFAEQAADVLQARQTVARVVAVDRSAYLVRGEGGEIPAELAGRFRFTSESGADHPCVGDWVCVQQASPDLAIIHAVLPRRSFLRRKRAGKTVDFQMIAANIDQAFVVQSCHFDFNMRRLDRYLVACREGGIEPIIILSKTDLVPPDELDGLMLDLKAAGITTPVVPVSKVTGGGMDRFAALVEPGKTCCFIGSSGVGKSTLINHLMGDDQLETKAVSATGEGTHTTTRRQLLVQDDGTLLIDTPGMRELGLLGASESVSESFAEIHELAMNCRFADCSHTNEPGCAVQEAIANDDLDKNRYRSFLKLRKETQFHDMSYLEKRKKDKAFGRFLKAHKKQKAKY